MEDFFYPVDKLDGRAQFVYQGVGSPDQVVFSLEFVEKEGILYQVVVSGSSSIKYDSTISLIENRGVAVETYKYDYDSLKQYQGLLKGTIKQDERTENGTPYGRRESIVKYEKNDIESIYKYTQNFIRDTIYNWNGMGKPALYFQQTTEVDFEHSYIPFIGKSIVYKGYHIYAKGLGIVKYGNEIDGEMIEWELISIESTETR